MQYITTAEPMGYLLIDWARWGGKLGFLHIFQPNETCRATIWPLFLAAFDRQAPTGLAELGFVMNGER
jgi:hypothetical protein